MNTKGIIIVFLFFAGFFAFQTALISYVHSQEERDTIIIGQRQNNLFTSYLDMEFSLISIEELAKVSLHTSLATASAHGGFADCISSNDYPLLYSSETCTPTEEHFNAYVLDLFQHVFTERLQARALSLTGYTFTYGIFHTGSSYFFTGKNSQPLTLTDPAFTYAVAPSFKIAHPLPFASYAHALGLVYDHSSCLLQTAYNPLTEESPFVDRCSFSNDSFDWTIDKIDDIFLFELIPRETPYFAPSLTLRFALRSSDLGKLASFSKPISATP